MKWTFKKFLLKAMLALLILYSSANWYHNFMSKNEEPRNLQKVEEVKSAKVAEYIITEKMILGKLTEKLEEVSLEGKLDDKKNKYIKVEDGFFGERKTRLKYKGSYKMGLDKQAVEVKHIDQLNGIVYLKMPKPILISLELPFNQIDFKKVKGKLRFSMNDEEEKQYYKVVEKDIRKQLMSNKELMRQVDLYNKMHTIESLKDMAGIKSIIFE